MNGEESLIHPETKVAALSYNQVSELSAQEKIEMVVFSGTPVANILWKIMEMEIVEQRDTAMSISPAKPAEQLAAMNVAHAMAQFYHAVRGKIDRSREELLNEHRQKALEEDLKDKQRIEDIIFANQTGYEIEPQMHV